jgi:hypothetical protein
MIHAWKLSTFVLAAALVAVIGTGTIRTASADGQVKMEDAKARLVEAKGWLERAQDDKGGFRQKAIEKTNEAIEMAERGVEYASKHH